MDLGVWAVVVVVAGDRVLLCVWGVWVWSLGRQGLAVGGVERVCVGWVDGRAVFVWGMVAGRGW